MGVFLTADLHLGDRRCFNRRRPDGTRLRPFKTLDEMDAELIGRWNARVGASDLVYILGDLCMTSAFDRVAALRGRKRLILGNCDNESVAAGSGEFESVVPAAVLEEIELTHVPLPRSRMSISTRNAHGHLHAECVADPRYVCISVERTMFAPISLEQLLKRFELNDLG